MYPSCAFRPSQVNDFETKDFPKNSPKKPLDVGFNHHCKVVLNKIILKRFPLCFVTYGLDNPHCFDHKMPTAQTLGTFTKCFCQSQEGQTHEHLFKNGGKRNILLVKTDATSAFSKYRVSMDDVHG